MSRQPVLTPWNEKLEHKALQEAARRLGLSEAETPGLDGREYIRLGFCGYLILVDPLDLPDYCRIALIVKMGDHGVPKAAAANRALQYVSEAFGAPIWAEVLSESRKRLYERYGATRSSNNMMIWNF